MLTLWIVKVSKSTETINFFEKSIAIYKFKEKISAFTNRCVHRGCKIFSKYLLKNNQKEIFPITEIWNKLIKKNSLFGFNSSNKFYHVTDLEIYNKLLKNN